MLNAIKTLLNFFVNIATMLLSIVSFVWNTFKSLLTFLIALPDYIAFTSVSFSILPIVVIPFITACVSLYVVLRILNRGLK